MSTPNPNANSPSKSKLGDTTTTSTISSVPKATAGSLSTPANNRPNPSANDVKQDQDNGAYASLQKRLAVKTTSITDSKRSKEKAGIVANAKPGDAGDSKPTAEHQEVSSREYNARKDAKQLADKSKTSSNSSYDAQYSLSDNAEDPFYARYRVANVGNGSSSSNANNSFYDRYRTETSDSFYARYRTPKKN